jgi:protein TonB
MRNVKKSKKADLERRKFYFLEIGLILSLAFVIFAFEWKTYESRSLSDINHLTVDSEEVELVIRTSQPTLPPPPPLKIIQTTLMEIVDNNTEIDVDIEVNTEMGENKLDQTLVLPEIIDIENEDPIPFSRIEEKPSFIGGDIALMKHLAACIKYPRIARESGIQGTIGVYFIIEKDGSLSDIRLERGIGGGCDEEALRCIQAMPKWKPGKQRGKAVRVSFIQPIRFYLQ